MTNAENFRDHPAKTLESLATKVGRTEKTRREEIAAVVFLKAMEALGGTFVWSDGPNRGDQHENIFEALAATLPEYSASSIKQKGAFIEERAPVLRGGFYAARRWLQEWYGDTIFCVPQKRELALPTVITFNPDFVLADSGFTASKMQAARDLKLANGQIVASTKRLHAALRDKTQVTGHLKELLEHATHQLEDFHPTRIGE